MSKDKLQVCVSFKNTEEEQELYMYTLGQADKSAFIKNLIRLHKGNNVDTTILEYKPPKKKSDDVKLKHGTKTRNKYLA